MVLWLISYLILHLVPGEVDGSVVDRLPDIAP